MGLHPELDEWRYKIICSENSSLNSETDAWKPRLELETEIIWELDVAQRALEFLKEANPQANFTLMRTRDRWEKVRD